MTTLMDLGIDVDSVEENDGTGGRQIVPKGKYKAVMVKSALNDNNAKTGKVFETSWQIVDGPHSDVVLKDWWNVRNPSTTCQNIGLGTLKRVCRLTGVPCPPPDETQMYGKPLLLTVNVKKDYKDETKFQNEITAYNVAPADFVPAEVADVVEPASTVKSDTATEEPW